MSITVAIYVDEATARAALQNPLIGKSPILTKTYRFGRTDMRSMLGLAANYTPQSVNTFRVAYDLIKAHPDFIGAVET